MAISSLSFCIPPDAVRNGEQERVRGYFIVTLLSSSWVLPRSIPANLEAQIWFSGDGQLSFPLSLCAGHEVHFPIVSPPAAFNRYLRDLQSLYIPIRDLSKGTEKPFASCVLCLDAVDLNEAQIVNVPVHGANTRCLGHLEIRLEARFSNFSSQHVETETRSLHTVQSPAHSVQHADLHAEKVLDEIENVVNSQAAGGIAEAADIKDILPLIHAAVQRRTWQAVNIFRQLDHNKSGKLDADDSVRLVSKILPFQLQPTHHCYLRFMLDVSGDKEFTFQQLKSAIKDCKDAAVLCFSSENRQVSSRLSNAAFDIQQRTLELGKMFRQHSDTEQLHIPKIVAIVAKLVNNWDEQLQRILLTKAYKLLPKLSDQASLGDVKHVFRTIILEQSQPSVSRSKACSQSQHRAQASDQKDLIDQAGTQVDDLSMPLANPIDGQARVSPRKLSDQTFSNQSRPARQSLRMQTHTSQTFETEYKEICNLLAACRQASPGSRQHRRVGTGRPSQTQVQPEKIEYTSDEQRSKSSHVELLTGEAALCHQHQEKSMHCGSTLCRDGSVSADDLSCSDDIIDMLMSRALHLKRILASLASSVQSVSSSRSPGCNTAHRHSDSSPYASGCTAGQKAQDVADLAALKALTAPLRSVASSAAPRDLTKQARACTAELELKVHEENEHLTERTTPAQHPPGNVCSMSAGSSACEPHRPNLRDDADVTACLTVFQLCEVVLSQAVRTLMAAASNPAFWLACRMPGSAGVRTWLMLAPLPDSALQRTDEDDFCVHGLDFAAESKVFLATSSLRAIKALGQPMTMQCEIWLLDGPDPSLAIMNGHSSLIGLLAVPLHMQVLQSRTVELARGMYKVRNVLEGFTGAQVCICVSVSAEFATLLVDVLPSRMLQEDPPDAENCKASIGAMQSGSDTFKEKQDSPQPESTAAHCTVNHEFKVHILSITLPAQQASNASHTPVARYLKCAPTTLPELLESIERMVAEWRMTCRYTFPCDDQALYTQDIPVQESHQFEDATFALHRIGLPQGAPILKHLRSEASSDDLDLVNLTFEVFDCFEEDMCMEDAVCFKGTLPVRKILEATKINAPEWEQAASMAATRLIPPQAFTCQNRFDVALSGVTDSLATVLPPPTVLIDVQYTCELIVPHEL